MIGCPTGSLAPYGLMQYHVVMSSNDALFLIGLPPSVLAHVKDSAERNGLPVEVVGRIVAEFAMWRGYGVPLPPGPVVIREETAEMSEARRQLECNYKPAPRPKAVDRARAQVERFVADYVVVEEGATVRNMHLFFAYREWAMDHGQHLLTHRVLTQVLELKGHRHLRTSGRPWIGLRLRDDVAPYPA